MKAQESFIKQWLFWKEFVIYLSKSLFLPSCMQRDEWYQSVLAYVLIKIILSTILLFSNTRMRSKQLLANLNQLSKTVTIGGMFKPSEWLMYNIRGTWHDLKALHGHLDIFTNTKHNIHLIALSFPISVTLQLFLQSSYNSSLHFYLNN